MNDAPRGEGAAAIVRAAVRDQRPYSPGTTLEEAKRRFGVAEVIKLSSNENPLGTSPRAQAALADIGTLAVYVDNDYPELRARLAAHTGVAAENVIVGHGSNELLGLMFETFVEIGDGVVMARPTFSLFPHNARLRGARVREVALRDGVHDLDAMLGAVDAHTKLVVLCDPNNPTATAIDPDAMACFVAALPANVLLVIDQAYREYMPEGGVDGVALAMRRPNTLAYRTMSKAFGLAALRIGYAIGAADAIGYMQRIRLPFNVTKPAMVAAMAALDDGEFVAESVRVNALGRAFLHETFARLGLPAYPSAANFIAVGVPVDSDEAYVALMRRGVVVRSGNALGLPGYLRVTVGTPPQNAAVAAAFEALVTQWRGVSA